MINPEPDIEKNGHPWVILKIVEKNKVKLLL